MADAAIVRNRAKILAAITNARAALDVRPVRAGLVASRPRPGRGPARAPRSRRPPTESKALAKALKRRGFVFVGPTTAYAAMQACGLVDDHIEGCCA